MLPSTSMQFRDGETLASPDGLFVGGRKVADWSDVVKTFDAGDVSDISTEDVIQLMRDVDTRTKAAVEGVGAAALLGTVFACYNKCSGKGGVAKALLAIIGAPIVAGFVAMRTTGHPMRVVYRAP